MKQNFFLMYLLIVATQMLICNYFHVSPYITLSILPAAILCLPTRFGAIPAMLIAFFTGLIVDLLVDGVSGMNAAALVPVAFVRSLMYDSIFGKEIRLHGEDISLRKFGLVKFILSLLIVQSIFLGIYIMADGGAARPMIFNLLRFALSLVVCTALSLVIVHLLDPNERK